MKHVSSAIDRARRTRFRRVGSVGLLLVAGSTPSLTTFTGARPAWGQERTALIEYTDAETAHRAGPDDLRLRVGGADGADLYAVTDILPRSDGSFVVVNRGTSELYLFDSSGAHLWSAGQSGHGPGEFTDISHVALLPGDSLAVLDALARRVSLFDPDGDFVESFPLEPPFEGAGFATLLVALADGTLLIGHSEGTMDPRPEAVYFRQRIFRYSTAGERLSTEGLSIPRSEHFVQAVPERFGRVAYWDLAFGRRMTVRPSPDGGLFIGDGTEWTVERRTVDGTVSATHRLLRAIEPVTAADRAAHRSRLFEGETGPRREMIAKLAEEMPYPATRPAYRRFEVDDAGRLWLEAYASPAADVGALWIRLDPGTGTSAGVRFPPRYRAFAFRGDFVYGIWRDDLDIEYVHVYTTESM